MRESSVVHRLGYGTLQLTGTGVWGEPEDPNEAVRVLGRAVEPGVDFIDTADSYDLWRSWENLETAREPLQADSDRHGISIDRSSWTRRGARSSERC
nr:aldo/keto reductase [Nocardia amikacinitolerans]